MSQEVRDAVARLEGWIIEDTDVRPGRGPAQVWRHRDGGWMPLYDHPIPDTLDACAKAWDEQAGKHGWSIELSWCYMSAKILSDHYANVSVATTGTIHNADSIRRYWWALLGLVLKARGVA